MSIGVPCALLGGSFGVRSAQVDGASVLGFEACEKFHEAHFGPVACGSRVARNEGAMASVLGGDQTDMGVVRQCGVAETSEGNEGIILRGHDQSGHEDVRHNPQRARPGVIIGGAKEAAVLRGNRIVEFAHRMNSCERGQVKIPRK